MRIGRADGIELTPKPHFEGRARLFVGELHDLLAQQHIADRHRQVIERTEAGKESLQHRLVGDIDAFAACVIAEPSERPAQFLGRTRGDRDPCTLGYSRLGGGRKYEEFQIIEAVRLGGLAEFERDLIRARTSEGRERAKARGVKLGRKPKLTDHQRREAIRRRDIDGEPVREIARSYNVSHSTISRLAA